MEAITIRVSNRDEEAAVWPEASPEERLNSTAMMVLLDNFDNPRDEVFFIHFTTDSKAGTITYRSRYSENIVRLRHLLTDIPEFEVTDSTV